MRFPPEGQGIARPCQCIRHGGRPFGLPCLPETDAEAFEQGRARLVPIGPQTRAVGEARRQILQPLLAADLEMLFGRHRVTA